MHPFTKTYEKKAASKSMRQIFPNANKDNFNKCFELYITIHRTCNNNDIAVPNAIPTNPHLKTRISDIAKLNDADTM